jgi:hypothetical protein
MRRWILLTLVAGCARTVATAPQRQGPAGVDFCPVVLETVQRILGPFTDDYMTLEEGCVHAVATANGVTYAEAVGFAPMPLETITCQAPGWVVRIGQKPAQAPTQGVLLVGFEEERAGARQFTARVERAGWREQPNRVAFNGCGTVEGTVTRKGDGWAARTSPQNLGW